MKNSNKNKNTKRANKQGYNNNYFSEPKIFLPFWMEQLAEYPLIFDPEGISKNETVKSNSYKKNIHKS